MPSTLDESGCPMYSILMDNNSSNVAVQCDAKKQCEDISYVKQKMLEADLIIRHYKNKNLFDKSGRFDRLSNSPDGYNEACNFNVAASNELNNNYDVIPQAVGLAKEKALLEARLASTDIKIQEMKSHINQLQMLVTEYETQIEALKIENQLQKCNTKEFNTMINDICLFRDIVLGKKKMLTRHKKVLKKYDKYKSTANDISDCSIDEMEICNQSTMKPAKKSKNKSNQVKDLMSETSTANKKIGKGSKLMLQVNGRQDFDSGNEIINEDSGFSSFGNSPDYYPTNSPCSTTNYIQKEKKNYIDIATSPITVQEEVKIITHPTDIENQKKCSSCSQFSNNLKTEKTYTDIATSPVTIEEYIIEIINSGKDCTESDQYIQDDLPSECQNEKLIPDEPNKTSAVQETQIETNDEVQDCVKTKQLASSEIESYFNDLEELVRDHPMNDRPQEENNEETNEINAVEEDLKDVMNDDKDSVSLCDSDIIERCLFGQDSFETNIPLVNETNQKQLSDVATSPITVRGKLVETATSPITVQGKLVETATSPITVQGKLVEMATSPITVQGKLVEIATSPVKFVGCLPNNLNAESIKKPTLNCTRDVEKSKTIGINTVAIKKREKATSPIKFDVISGNQKTTLSSSERECLELNNSKKLNSCHDCEVETILRTMRLDRELITPIPKSPAKPQTAEPILRSSPCRRCQDMAKLKKENENLQSTFQDIAKSMSNMTWLIKSRGVLINNNLHSNDKESSESVIDDFTPPITSNVNIEEFNNETESIPNYLPSSEAIKNKPIVATDVIRRLEFGEKENHLKKKRVLNKENQPTSDSHVLKLAQNCDNQNSLNNNQILNRSNETLSDESITEDINQDEQIPNTDLVTSCEIDKEINKNKDQSCNMHVDEENVSRSPTKKVKKALKLTKLEKWKRTLIPKSKIRRELTPPIRKNKKKQILKKKAVLDESPKPKLAVNNNAAYKKAVEIMAELRDKEKNKTIAKPTVAKAVEKSDKCKQEVLIVLSKCDDFIQKQTSEADSHNHDKAINKANAMNNAGVQKETCIDSSPSSASVTTRSRSKRLSSELFNSPKSDKKRDEHVLCLLEKENSTSPIRRGRKRCASDKSESTPKRILRGSGLHESSINKTDNSNANVMKSPRKDSENIAVRRTSNRLSCSRNSKDTDCGTKEIVNNNDMDVSTQTLPENKQQTCVSEPTVNFNDRIFCRMLEKYAITSVKFHAKKLPDAKINMIASKLEDGIANIIEQPRNAVNNAMDDLVDEIQNWEKKVFVTGLMMYLKKPARKDELFNTVLAPPAPPMTKSEQVLLYILKQLKACWDPDIIETIMKSIEFSLFQLNHTPDFGTVESLSHFYAILCRYFSVSSRLRLFMLDAMYCIQFKSVALIKQCLNVWMHILPLSHMGMAKCPLVMCLIYLLHFFKCDDKYNRVQEIRDILRHKYFYEVTDWSEPKMLEMFKNAILEIREVPVEKKMLRLAFIILAKRKGPNWTQKNIIKDMIQPLIEKAGVRDGVREFSVSILGPLMKPYPNDMKVHCEVVVNQLLEMVDNAKPSMETAIFTSLLYMRRHNPARVNQALVGWRPRTLHPDLEGLLKDYIRERPARVWKIILSKIQIT